MDSSISGFSEQQVVVQGFKQELSRIALAHVYAERRGYYVNDFTVYIAHFNAIPNVISESKIDCIRAEKWFKETYRSEIRDQHYFKGYMTDSKHAEINDIFYILFEDLLVEFEMDCSSVRFLFRTTAPEKVEAIAGFLKRFRVRKERHKPEISLIVSNVHGIDTKKLKISKPKMNIADNYNDDFGDIHDTIIRRLSKQNDKGIVLLHGKPGTGKTSYIRYLVSTIKKKVIFLPPNMAAAITNPDLISILIANPNCILVIEDAENIVVDREKDGDSPVSALLNISDGLLSDCLNIQIICSFNTDITKIDSALMRKGRLIAKYEFKELDVEKARTLSDKLGFNTNFNLPMTLTAIYNQVDIDFQQSKKRNAIGFVTSENN